VKRILALIFIFVLSPLAFAESPAPDATQDKPKEEKVKAVDFSKVNAKVSDALCQKMQQCSPKQMSTGECLSEVKGTFQKSYNSIPKEKQFQVNSSDLDLCTTSINNSSCDELKAAHTLKGCDFIKQLPPTS